MRRGLFLFLSFSAAVFLAVYLLPVRLLPWLALAAAGAGFFAAFRKRTALLLILAGLAAAFLWTWGYHSFTIAPAQQLDGRRTRIVFTLAEYPQATAYGAKAEGYVRAHRLPVRTSFYGTEALLECKPGDVVTVTADCSLATRYKGEETRSFTAKGIFLLARSAGHMEVDADSPVPLWLRPGVWAKSLRDGIRSAFPDDVSGLIAALATGDTTDLSDELDLDLSRSGVRHLAAVSGMHICFLVGLLTFLTGRDPRRRATVCIPVIVLFTLLVGASPSVLRAAVMQLVLLVAPLVLREEDPPTSIAFALFALLVINPYAAANVGLQLSFAAVVGIRVISPRLREKLLPISPKGDRWWKRLTGKLVRFIWTSLATTLGAIAFTLPLSLLYFNTVSLVSPLTNLLVIPAVSVLFAAGLLLGVLAIPLPGAAALMGRLLAPLARYVQAVVSGCASLPFAAVTTSDVYYPALIVGLYGLLLVALLWRGQRRRVWVFLLAGAVMTAGSVFFTSRSFHAGSLTVTALDVGQGQSILLSSGGKTALVDCGGSARRNAGDIAADYLLDRGARDLDLLVLTHYHSDHANGISALFRRLNIRAVAVPDTDEGAYYRDRLLDLCGAEGCSVTYVTEDTWLSLGETELSLYAPLGDGDANEAGLSVLASAGDFDLLITGDINATVEERLVKYHRLPDCEALVAGHHGSRTSTGDTLLDAVRPETALISVGPNDYGHPADQTLDRLRRRGIACYRTDLLGNITLTVG